MADTRTLFVLGFPEEAQARAALTEMENLRNSAFLKAADWALVKRDADGKVTFEESPSGDPGALRGAAVGGVAGTVAVLLGPIGWAGAAAAVGLGAVAGKLHDAGFKSKDMEAVGDLMADGRTVLLIAVTDEYVANMRAAMQDVPEFLASDRSMESPVTGDASEVLRKAVEEYRASHPEG
jgi:uncharacterized membrane protein